MVLWKTYKETIIKNCLVTDTDQNGLAYWRNKLFCNIMLYFAPLSIFSVVPGIIMSFIKAIPLLGIIDFVALVTVFFISFNKRLSIKTRKILFIVLLYVMATVLIRFLGSFGPGLLYLLVITIFCLLIFSNHWAYTSVIINAGICFVFGFVINLKLIDDSIFHQYTVGSWATISVNLVIVSLVMAVLLPLIFNGLQHSNERYEMVALATSDTVFDWDIKKDVTLYNESVYEMFGYHRDDVKSSGSWWRERIHPEDVERVTNAQQNTLKSGKLRLTLEYRFRCANGCYKYVLDRSYIILDEEKKPIRVIGALQDINQRKESEHWLRLTESVIAHATDAVIIVTPDAADELGREIIYANEAFAKMTGYTTNELLGLRVGSLYGPESDMDELSRLRTALFNGEPYKGEILNYKKNGQTFWNNKSISPVKDVTGKITHWISIERDVTLRNTYIRAIVDQNAKLKAISWTQSHVVRAPLTRIMGLVNLLNILPPDNVHTSEVLEYIVTSANELDMVIKEIIKHAEVDDGVVEQAADAIS